MIDVHCHFDVSDNPVKYITNNELKKVVTIGMTNLPSHFKMGYRHIVHLKYIRLALGMHPLRANEHEREFSKFSELINLTTYIGEVGLDFSKDGVQTKEQQIKSFEFVLDTINRKKKIISLHSRRAEKEVLEMLIDKKINSAIFHWYSGSLIVLKEIVNEGYYFSVNSAMINSINGRKIIGLIPKELILTETDFPYIKNSNIISVYKYLSILWEMSTVEVEKIIDNNLKELILNR